MCWKGSVLISGDFPPSRFSLKFGERFRFERRDLSRAVTVREFAFASIREQAEKLQSQRRCDGGRRVKSELREKRTNSLRFSILLFLLSLRSIWPPLFIPKSSPFRAKIIVRASPRSFECLAIIWAGSEVYSHVGPENGSRAGPGIPYREGASLT